MYMNGTGMIMMAWMGLLTFGLITAAVVSAIWLAPTGDRRTHRG